MKEGWTYKKLGEVFKTYAGGTPSKTNKANYENGTIPWIRSGEVCRKYITESELFISEEGLKSSSAKYYPVNTVLVAMYGATAAQCGILRFEATSNQAVCGILPHKDFLPEFVYSFFTYFKDELASQAQGGAQPNISQDKIKKILFPCISLSEQQRIVSRLDVAFAHIDELKANAEKQLSEARALFQKALTKAMEPKEGWEEKKLGDVCKSVNYGTSLPSTENGKYKYLRMNNITIDGTLDLTNLKTIDVPEKDFEKCVVRKGDLLFNRTNSPELVGKTCIFKEDEEMIIAGYIIRIRFNDSIYPQFASYFINLQRQLGNLRPLIVGAVHQANISAKAIQSINIQFPPLAEQQRIVERLDALSENIRKYEEIQRQIISECDALKQALLRKVFE